MISTTNNVYQVQNNNNLHTKYNKYMYTPDTNMSQKKKADQLLLLIVNFQSILGKKEEIELMLLGNKIDIVLGSETHLKPHISDNEFLHPSYTCYRRDRDDGFGGAIIITKKDPIVEEIVKSETCEFLAIKIQTHSQPLILATAYRPPSSPLEEAVNVSNELIKLNIKYKNNSIWFGGDMNLPDINWKTNSIIKHQYLKDINECFLDTFLSSNLEQIVDFPTRGTNTWK